MDGLNPIYRIPTLFRLSRIVRFTKALSYTKPRRVLTCRERAVAPESRGKNISTVYADEDAFARVICNL